MRDYAKSRRSNRRSGKATLGWLWLLSGITVGLFIAFLYYLSQQGRGFAISRLKDQSTTATAPAQKPETAKQPEKKPMNFDFYTKLRDLEVEVPEDNNGAKTPPPVATPGSYILQAGAFSTEKDAESRKAELAFLGIRASVQSVTVEGNVYHRVRIGPYSDLERVNKVRQTLRENRIEFVTLKERS